MKMRFRILFVFRRKNPLFFSIEKVFDSIAPDIKRFGWEITQTYVPFYSSGLLSIIRNIAYLFKRNKAAIFHITGDIHYAVFAFPANRTILTIHDCIFIHQSKGIKRWLMKHLFLRWPVRYAKFVTTISEQSKQEIVRYGNCNPSKVIVIPNPVRSTISFNVNKKWNNKPIILFIGSTPNKNLGRVLVALKGINCTLDIVGRVSGQLRTQIAELELDVLISERISEEELNEKYYRADLLLFPSLFEGFGLPILEAQQAGTPVVTSNIAPMRETGGQGACLVDPFEVRSIREGVLKVIQDEKYRQELVTLGKQNSSLYSLASIATRYADLYRQIDVNP
jgi:glycosyltransferase involved in cell wall biosynthesis